MTLTTSRPITSQSVEDICGQKDAVYRNCWITYGYFDLSSRLRPYVGDNASWCTFARWSSFTVGENLRPDQRSRRLDDVLSRGPLRLFRGVAQKFYSDVRTIDDAAMPRTLALGNHYVFHEIGHAVASFLDWLEESQDEIAIDAEKAWSEFKEKITPYAGADELFRPGDVSWLQDGLRCYFDAALDDDPTHRALHVLRGNILIAAYEQWRLDPILQIALDPFARHLVEFHSIDPHPADDPHPAEPHAPGDYPHARLRRQGTRWALRHRSSLRQWLADIYASTLTRHWMTLEMPAGVDDMQAIVLGRGVPNAEANSAFLRQRRLDDHELMKVLAIFDHNSHHRIQGAKNWNSFADRMQFIVELFLAYQNNPRLYEPLPDRELALLQIDIDDENLKAMRRIGDPDMDAYVADHYLATSADPRALVRDMVKNGVAGSLDSSPGEISRDLPTWADPDKLHRGQQFFRDHAVEIATALFTASLPLSYTAEHGARVLTRTAELASGNVNRRVAETGKLLLDIMTLDDDLTPLQRDTQGWRAAQGVRTFHAAIRHMLAQQEWDTKQHGVPVNQEDLLGTLVAFSVVVLDSLDTMGVDVGPEAQEAYVHLWVVVGYVLGIDYSLIHRPGADGARPEHELTLAELRIIGNALWRRNARASADGQSLAAAILQLFRQNLPGPLQSLPAAAIRHLIGDESGDVLEVPNAGAPARLVLRVGRPVTRLIARGRRAGILPRRLSGSTIKLYEEWIRNNHGDRPPWDIDDDVKRKLGLEHVDPRADDRRKARAN
jgi:ER-bound oxygenase mpaB/B'/Rubber oxygenase, catalytic domain